MTHNFNLTDLEKSKIENVLSAIHSMINYDGDDYLSLATDILELIYGKERAKEIQNFIEDDFNKDDSEGLIKAYNDGEFFITNSNVDIIKNLFTKN